MGRLSSRNQMLIAAVLVVVATLAVVFFGILPMFQEMTDLSAEIATEETNLATAQALVARRQSAKLQSAANEVELMAIANRVPDAPQLPSVIIELQDLANSAGLSFQQITVGDMVSGTVEVEGEPPTYSVVPIAVLLHGDWAEMIDFFHRLEGLDRGTRVVLSTFNYVPEDEETDAYVEANITLEVYVMAAASVGGEAPATPADGSQPAEVSPDAEIPTQ